jgi:hypothetical protein
MQFNWRSRDAERDPSDPDRDGRGLAAERLSYVLREHGTSPPVRPILRYILLGFVVGAATGLIIGWLIWA